MKFIRLLRKPIMAFFMLLVVLCSACTGYAYNWSAPHNVNQGVEDYDAKAELFWQFFRSQGFSEEATAGIIGNIYQECTYDHTLMEGSRKWQGDMSYLMNEGTKIGIGFFQWTNGRISGLMQTADNMGRQWTDLEVQLTHAMLEINTPSVWIPYTSRVSSVEEFKSLTDIERALYAFCQGYERPNLEKANMPRRLKEAQRVYSLFTGKAVVAPDLGLGDEYYTEDSSGNTVLNTSKIIEEFELEGMAEEGYAEGKVIILPTNSNFTIFENHNMVSIKDQMNASKGDGLYGVLRVFSSFCGLCVLLYAMLFYVAYLFDRVNTFIDISFISVITFGNLEYSESDDVSRGIVNKRVFPRIFCSLIAVGLFLVSGVLYRWIIRLVLFIF